MKNIISTIGFMLLLVAFISCNNKSSTETGKVVLQEKANKTKGHKSSTIERGKDNTSKSVVSGKFHKVLKSGGIEFIVDCDNVEKSNLSIAINGLERTNYKESFTIDAKVEDAIIVDLNKDNYMELYILMAKNDGSGNKDLMAVGVNRNKSAGEIYIQKSRIKKTPNTDSFMFDGELLQRKYIDDKGESLQVNYVLVAGESGYRLIPNMHYVKN